MKIPPPIILVGGGVLLLLILAPRLVSQAAAAIGETADAAMTGQNKVTERAHDWEGAPVDAYYGKGLLGTAGAVANEASGGLFASVGGWIGRTAWDIFNPDPMMVMNHTKT